MTTAEHNILQRILADAAKTAKESGLRIAVTDAFYHDEKEERFQYCPIVGLDILYRPKHFALVGIAEPDGSFTDALSIAIRS